MAVMCDEAKQAFVAECKTFARRLHRMSRHMLYTAIATLALRCMSWINIPLCIAHVALWIHDGEPYMPLVFVIIALALTGLSLSAVLSSVYKYMLMQCNELDRSQQFISEQTKLHPEWVNPPLEVEL